MNERNFGDVTAYYQDGEWRFRVCERLTHSKQRIEQLEDDIRSARMWVRDQERRQAENETPELPLT